MEQQVKLNEWVQGEQALWHWAQVDMSSLDITSL